MKLKNFFLIFIVSICSWQSVWARVAPTLPEAQIIEDGRTYYLYNVASDRFMARYNNYSSPYALDYNGLASTLVAVNEAQYTIMFSDKYYLGSQYLGPNAQNKFSTYGDRAYQFTIFPNGDGYTLLYNNQYVGIDGYYVNLISGDVEEDRIVWQFLDATEAERFVAKRNLYRALESAEGYNVDKFEAIYEDEESSNSSLQEAADILNKAVEASNTIQNPSWSDYKTLFEMDVNSVLRYKTDEFSYKSTLKANNSVILNGTVVTDEDATLAFSYRKQNAYSSKYVYGTLEVYVDGDLSLTVNNAEGTDKYQRYFIEISSGKHEITWKYTNTGSNDGADFYIGYIGVVATPTIYVSLKEPGSLGTEVLAQTDHIKNVRKLVIEGSMNSDDWSNILLMNRLFSLDLSSTTITEIPAQQLSLSSHSDNLSFLHEVKLPPTLKKIGKEAFKGTYLDEIVFPEGLESIGGYAFYDTRIKEAILPETVTTFDVASSDNDYIFAYNQSLTKASIPLSAKYIPDYCFYKCNYLTPFEIPEGVQSIGNDAFYDCWNFSSNLPSSVMSIGTYAFYNSAMKSIEINENASVGNYAFQYSKLTNAVLPTTCFNEIAYLFANCTSLTDVTFKSPTMVTSSKKNMFSGITASNLTIHVPAYLVSKYMQDGYWYNYNIEGFSTSEIKDWVVSQPLKMSSGQRIEGTPNIKVQGAGSLEISGDDDLTIGDFQTDFYNDNSGIVIGSTTKIFSTCDNVQITGDYIYNYHTNAKIWYFVTLPFDTKVGDISCPCSYAIRYYDGANRAQNGNGGNWKNYSADDVIPAGTGFIFQTSKAVWSSFKAQNNSSKQNVFANKQFTKKLETNDSEDNEHKGWNLVGNPWMTYYNIHKLNFTAPITTWNTSSRTYTAYSIIDDDYAIRPHQAFFVQCPSEDLNTIEFPIDGRQMTSKIETQNAARNAKASGRKLIDIELGDGERSDKTRLVINPQASPDYETERDASKFFSMDATVPQIYTIEDDMQLAINERPADKDVIRLGVILPEDGIYTIKAIRNELRNAVLHDNLTGQQTELVTSEYVFNGEAGQNEDRFEIWLSGAVVNSIDNERLEKTNSSPYYNLNGQRVESPRKGIYVVDGQKVIVR